jgi:amino acid adenylation domain-containing protein/non-ribosomal peptide synthase protein (TIGR01720 family)
MHEDLIEGFRLSPQQRRLWRLQELHGPAAFVVQCALSIEGALDPSVLRAAVERVVGSHEILRTTFHPLPEMGTALQVIGRGGLDWRAARLPTAQSRGERLTQCEELLDEARRPGFDLENGPVLRASLFAVSDTEHLLILTLPALSADLLTARQLAVETAEAYAALLRGDGDEDAAEVAQYADLSEWQDELLESEEARPGREYWRAEEAEPRRLLNFPYENRGREKSIAEPRWLKASLPAALDERLRGLARERGSSARSLLLAAWQALLWRLTGEQELVCGVAFDGRQYEEIEEALGLFVKHLPIRWSPDAGLTFAGLAAALEERLRGAGQWQEYFIDGDGLDADGRPDGLRVGFEFVEWPRPFGAAGLSLSFRQLYSRLDSFDLKLSCVQGDDSTRLELQYDGASLLPGAAERLAGHLQTLLADALARPDERLVRLDVLSPVERRSLLVEFNDTESRGSGFRYAHRQFESIAAAAPDEVAAVFQDERLTYGELNARANRLAHYLRAQGVGPDVIVGVCLPRSIELLVAMLGILKAGGAYLPLDPSYPRERLAFMVEDANVGLLLTKEGLRELLPPAVKSLALGRGGEQFDAYDAGNPRDGLSPENLAYVIYTSGSTGMPKGCAIPHRGLANYLSWGVDAYRVAEGQGSPVHSSIAFDLTITSIFSPLMTGRKVLLLDEEQAAGDALADALKGRPGFSLVKLTPAHLEWLAHALEGDELQGSAAALIVGGEALHAESLSAWRTHAPDTRIVNEYGPTETVVGCCVYELKAGEAASGTLPIGRPIANTRLYILDGEMNPVPCLVTGELYVGGEGVARGYLNRPDVTAERFVPDPFGPGAGGRLYKTGDLARHRPDGVIEFLGRRDQQVKIKGYRVELGEIEAVLGEHADVREAVVTLRADGGDNRLVAYVTAREGRELSRADLSSHLRKRLPEHMLPSAFVTLDRLPLTANGKIDRRALPPPETAERQTGGGYVAPRDHAEEILAGIWADVLGVERVGVEDNFFALGGDSIRGIQAVSRANRAGLKLTTHQLFRNQTVAGLASVAGSAPAVRAEQGEVTGDVPLTPIQHWFFERGLPEPQHFNQSVLLESGRGLNPSLLEQAVAQLSAHHDALRLRFERTANGWRQHQAPAVGPAPVSHVVLASSTEEEYRAALEEVAARSQAALNLAQGPLLKVTLFQSSRGLTDRLHIAAHHLAIDGVSWRILLEDLQHVYEQLAGGEEVRLPPKTTSYQYWAQRLCEYARTDALRQEALYWDTSVGTRDDRLPLDFEAGNGSNTEADARSVTSSLDEEETRALLHDAPQSQQVLADDLLLTALARSVTKWAGGDSLLVCLESHGRQDIFADVDLSRTVGWFTALFPVRLTLPADPNPGAELKAIKEQLRRVPNRGIGYGLLRYLCDDPETVRRLEALPRPEVLFNYFGSFDHVLPASSPFGLRRESAGHERGSTQPRDFPLTIDAYVLEGRLLIEWTYGSKLHRRETIEALAADFVKSLRLLVNYCRTAATAAYTPSDFRRSKLSQAELDRVLSKLIAPGEKPA